MTLVFVLTACRYHAVEHSRRDIAAKFYLTGRRNISGNISHLEGAVSHCSFNFRACHYSIVPSECGGIIYQVNQAKFSQEVTNRAVFAQSVTGNHPVDKSFVKDSNGVAHHSVAYIKRVKPFRDLFIILGAGTVAGVAVFHIVFHMVWEGNA